MQNYIIVIYISMVLWLLPPIKNYKTNFFIYFLALAVCDPIGAVFSTHHILEPSLTGLLFSFIILVSLRNITDKSKLFDATLAIVFIFMILSFISLRGLGYGLVIVVHILIFFTILKRALTYIAQTGAVNIFYFVLLFYEATIVMKYFVIIFDLNEGVLQFAITTTFQLMFAIFFALSNENSQRLIRKLKIK